MSAHQISEEVSDEDTKVMDQEEWDSYTLAQKLELKAQGWTVRRSSADAAAEVRRRKHAKTAESMDEFIEAVAAH